MARVKLGLDRRTANHEGAFPLSLIISHNEKTRMIKMGLHLKEDQWIYQGPALTGKKKPNPDEYIIKGIKNSIRVTAKLYDKLEKARTYLRDHELELPYMDVAELKRNIEVEIKKTPSTPTTVIAKATHGRNPKATLKQVGDILISLETEAKEHNNASWLQNGLNNAIRFNNNNDIHLLDIDYMFFERFKIWGKQEHFIPMPDGSTYHKKPWEQDTLYNNFAVIRKILKHAAKRSVALIPKSHIPWEDIEIYKAEHEADSVEKYDIQRIRALDFPVGSSLWKSRAEFLFMFNCQGMNYTDMANLKVSDVKNGSFHYFRSKNRNRRHQQRIDIDLTSEALAIWDYFSVNKEPHEWTFEILGERSEPYTKYYKAMQEYNARNKSEDLAKWKKNRIKRRLKQLNDNLAIISEMIDFHKPIKSYDARYGWTNSALDIDAISDEMTSKGLGHTDLRTLRKYKAKRHKRTNLHVFNEVITQ